MATSTFTNCDMGSVELDGGQFNDELLVFTGAATVSKGTLLARRAVATAVTASAVTGTGTGTCTSASVIGGPVVPMVGAYKLVCTSAVANGGIFRLEDPNGMIVATDLRMTAGAGAATTIKAAGLQFTLTDAGTDFVAGDYFTLTVAADGKLVPLDTAGVGGAQVPVAVLTHDVTATGAGNVPVRPLVRGSVKKERLIVAATGDGSTITTSHLETLRGFGILAISVTQLAGLDNQ